MSPSSPKPKTNNFNVVETLNSESNDERRVIERVNKLAATTQGRPHLVARAGSKRSEREVGRGDQRCTRMRRMWRTRTTSIREPSLRRRTKSCVDGRMKWQNFVAMPFHTRGTTGSTTGATTIFERSKKNRGADERG